MRDVVRVALLARPGAGADRLREALRAAGAEVVLDADPTTLDPDTLAGSGAGSVVVVLDAAVEDALARLETVLHDPAIDVLYEESAVAAAREGWDAARWARHLSAKLQRHDDVLPPGREPDAATPPAAPASPVRPAPVLFDPVAAEYDDDGAATDADHDADPPATAAPGPDTASDATPELPPSMELTLESPAGATTEPPSAPASVPSLPAAAAAPRLAPVPDRAPASPPAAPPLAPGDRSDVLRDFRRDLAGIEQRIASMSLVGEEPAAAGDAAPPPAAPPAPREEPAPAAPAPPPARGAVLVFAGIGGPDAIRQFLGALPDAFPRPVLIHQRLDGGRHDRLVQQMARATTLPVQLAVDGEGAAPGHVYILPPGLGLDDAAGGLRFVAGTDPLDSLPPGGSAVLMFSGSDTALVDAAMGHASAGAMVAGQSPQDCYDAAAADALVSRGAESGEPAELARRLADRWAA